MSFNIHQRRRRISRLGAVSAMAAAVALVVSGCSATDGGSGNGGEASAGSENYAITFVPKFLGAAYFKAADKGGETAVEEFSGTFSEVGPTTPSPDSQVPFINTLTQQQVGGIVISANDPNAICDALNQAREAGIKVVVFDSDTDPSCRDIFVSQASVESIAKTQVDIIAEEIDDAGEIAILSATANATNQNAWIEIMEEYLATDYPDITLVDVVYGEDEDQISFDKTAALLQTYPELDGIISPTAAGLPAAARYLSTSSLKGQVALTGLATPNQMRAYVADGTVNRFALWNPVDHGYLSAYTAKALIEGTITGAEGDTFEAGRLGSYTVEDGGIVTLGDAYVFDKDNIDDFDL